MNEHEIERIAAAMNHMRPDWPTAQLRTLLKDQRITNRPRRDVSVALAWVACETGTSTPYRVLEAGPWWKAAGVEGAATKRDEPANHERCSTCSLHRDRCRAINATDHDFRPWTATPEPVDTKATVQALKELVSGARAHVEPQPKPETPTNPNVEKLREAMTTTDEPTPHADTFGWNEGGAA